MKFTVPKYSSTSRRRTSLQLKAALVLTFIVVGVTLFSAWLYYVQVHTWLEHRDREEAHRLAAALATAARAELARDQHQALDALLEDMMDSGQIAFLALVDENGQVVARATHPQWRAAWLGLLNLPPSVSRSEMAGTMAVTCAVPVVSDGRHGPVGTLLGGGRVVLDRRDSVNQLRAIYRRLGLIAAAVVALALPLAYLLVWRLVVQPVHRLAKAARRIGEGDFSVRSDVQRDDEIGELGGTFDQMAAEVEHMQAELLRINDSLEHTVQERTAELHQANERLSEEVREKQEFLRAVSHDLNAPIRNIAGLTQMLQRKHAKDLPEDVTARLGRIGSNAEVCGELLDELLELSRIRTRPQKRQWVDFNALLAELAGAFEYDLKTRQIALLVQPEMPVLWVERQRLRQVFQNLIDNSIKYMHRSEGGEIRISCRRMGKSVEFCVADNGPGIPPGDLERVFTVFQRVESPEAARIAGKGVGLAVVRNVAANYQGRAWAESGPDGGARFYFLLAETRQPKPAEEPFDSMATSSSPPH